MAFSLNRAQIIGNLTRDPELRQTATGTAVVSFAVATNFSWKDQSGQQQEKVEFHNVVAWRKLAEICAQYLKKGMKIFIEGRLQTRDWQGEDGVKRYRTEIVADNMIMLGSKMEGGARPMAAQPAGVNNYAQSRPAVTPVSQQVPSEPAEMPAVPLPEEAEVSLDDLPF